jgi:predicted nucleic acid-binding protein
LIFVDSNVPMYLVGAAHRHKQRVIEMVPRLVSAREELVTSAEAFQEILHRYRALDDREHLNAAYDALATMVSQVADVTKTDVDAARILSAEHPRLSSRDCLHVAVMKRMDCRRVWSYDSGFDAVPSIERVA